MANVFIDNIVEFNQYDIPLDEDIFTSILKLRKNEFDPDRFFLGYVASQDLSMYDFNDSNSLASFRDKCFSCESPIKKMGGCNLRLEMLDKDIIYAGIKLSDPQGNIPG